MGNPDREVLAKFEERRGEKRPEDAGAEREVRARVREVRGQRRISEDDGRADLDEAAATMAKSAAEAGLARAKEKSMRVEAVSGRWCDIADENLQLDPFLNEQVWSESQRASLEVESGDEGIEDFGFEAPVIGKLVKSPDTATSPTRTSKLPTPAPTTEAVG